MMLNLDFWFGFALGGVLLVSSVCSASRARAFRQRAATALGEVVSVTGGGDDADLYVVVSFQANGHDVEFETKQFGNFMPGQRIEVLYLPSDEQVARLGGKYLFRWAYVYGIGGLFFLVLAVSCTGAAFYTGGG